MNLIGLPVSRDHVLKLSELLARHGFASTAAVLLSLDGENPDPYLTREEQDEILLALTASPSDGLEPLRLAILEERGQVDRP